MATATTFNLVYNYDLKQLVQSASTPDVALLDSEVPFVYYGMGDVKFNYTVINKDGTAKTIDSVSNAFSTIKDSADEDSDAMAISSDITIIGNIVTVVMNTNFPEFLDKLSSNRFVEKTKMQTKLRDSSDLLRYIIDAPVKCFKEDTVSDDIITPTDASGYVKKPVTYTVNHVMTFTAVGNAQDSGFTINDSLSTTSNLWSASKIASYVGTVGGLSSGGTSTNNAIALWNGTTGAVLKDSAVTLPSSELVGIDDNQTLTNKELTSPVITTPTGIVAGDVGLTNVTDDAQLKRGANDYTSFTAKSVLVDADVSLIEDSADTFNKKKYTLANLWTYVDSKADDKYTQGDSASTANNIATFDGTTGKIIQDSGYKFNDSGSGLTDILSASEVDDRIDAVNGVTGQVSSVNNTIVLADGTSGTAIKFSNSTLPVGSVVGTSDNQTISNKTMVSPLINDFITLKNLSTNPSNPASGYIRLFTKTDGHTYVKNSSGATISLDSQVSGYPDTSTFGNSDIGKPIVVGTPSSSSDVQLRNVSAVSTFSVDSNDNLSIVSGDGSSIGQIQIAFIIPATGLTSIISKFVTTTSYITGTDFKLIIYDGDYDRTITPPYPASILSTSSVIASGKTSELVSITSSISAATESNVSVVLSITTPSVYSALDIAILLESFEIYDAGDLSIPLFTWRNHDALSSIAGTIPNDYALLGEINSNAFAELGNGIPVYTDYAVQYAVKTTPANNDRIAINDSADTYAMKYISISSLNYRYVVGSTSAVGDNVAIFDGTSGKLIKDSGINLSTFTNTLTDDQKDALDNATTPDASNPFATMVDLSDKADLISGKVPSSQLPGFTDQVKEFANYASLPTTTPVKASDIYVGLSAVSAYVTYIGLSAIAASVIFNPGVDNITFTAISAGAAGNDIDLVFNGSDTINAVVNAWNSSNPSNTVGFTGQIGSYVPTAGTASLASGADAETILFTAVTAGASGNNIDLVFNGTSNDIDTIVNAWNIAHSSNTVGYTGQVGTYVPKAGTASLANGADDETITFTAVTGGEAGNNISLDFNGTTDDIDAVILAWNTANPTNTVGFTGQAGSYIPTAGTASLTGGIDAASTGVIYVTLDTNKQYRRGGTVYVELSESLALGETSGSAYRGDRGKTAYDHSLIVTGNPHAVTKTDIGLSNVANIKNNLIAIIAPTVSDDNTQGYSVGSMWVDTIEKLAYTCTSASTGTAEWQTASTAGVNSASSIGTGTAIYKDKVVDELEFKGIKSVGGTVAITNDATSVNIEVVSSGEIPFIGTFSGASSTGFSWSSNVLTVTHSRGVAYNTIALYEQATGVLVDYNIEVVDQNSFNIYFPISAIPNSSTYYTVICNNGTSGADGINFVFHGLYSSTTTYEINDAVQYNGSLWVSLVNANYNNTPIEGTYWTVAVSKGDIGATGSSYVSTRYVKGNITGAVTIDKANGDYQVCTTTGDVTGITISNLATESGMILRINNSGAKSVTFGSTIIVTTTDTGNYACSFYNDNGTICFMGKGTII